MSQRLVSKPTKAFKPSLVKRKPKPVTAAVASVPAQVDQANAHAQETNASQDAGQTTREPPARPEQHEQALPEVTAAPREPLFRAETPVVRDSTPAIPICARTSSFEPAVTERQVSPMRAESRHPSPVRPSSPAVSTQISSQRPASPLEVESAAPTQEPVERVTASQILPPSKPNPIPDGLRDFLPSSSMMEVETDNLSLLANAAHSQPVASTSRLPLPSAPDEVQDEAPVSKKSKASDKSSEKKSKKKSKSSTAAVTEEGEASVKKKKPKKTKEKTAKTKKKSAAIAEEGGEPIAETGDAVEPPLANGDAEEEGRIETFTAQTKKRGLGKKRSVAERKENALASDDSGFDTETRAEMAKKKKKKRKEPKAPSEKATKKGKQKARVDPRQADEEEEEEEEEPAPRVMPTNISLKQIKRDKIAAQKKAIAEKRGIATAAISAPAPAIPLPIRPATPVIEDDMLGWDDPILVQEEDYQVFIPPSPEPEEQPQPYIEGDGEDQEQEEEEEEKSLDPSTATMFELVKDPGYGRVTEKFMVAEQEKAERKAERAALRKKKRESIFGSDYEKEDEDENAETLPPVGEDEEGEEQPDPAPEEEEEVPPPEEEVIEEEEEYQETAHGPQYRLIDGRMVLDQNSLQIDRHANQDLDGDIVDEALGSRRLNSSTYGKRVASSRWTAASTAKFYEAIRENGSDFAMIALYFRDENRTRAQIKSKWKREEKINSDKITQALKEGKSRGDLTELSEKLGLDLSGPLPEDPLEQFYDYSGLIEAKKHSATPQAQLNGEDAPAEGAQSAEEEPLEEIVEEEETGPIEEVIEEDGDLPAV